MKFDTWNDEDGPTKSQQLGTLRGWYESGKLLFVSRLAIIGAAAGFASWALALALHLLLGVSRPSLRALLLAVPRGALFGAVLALVLGAYWDRQRRR